MPTEASTLTEIALRSKSYWGYPPEWIDLWKDELVVTPELIQESISYVAELNDKIVGFWCRPAIETDEIVPGRLFIEPAFIGKGIGKLLWEAIKKEALARGITKFTIDADPHAAAFYKKLGFKQIGEKESKVIPGRRIPILRIYLK